MVIYGKNPQGGIKIPTNTVATAPKTVPAKGRGRRIPRHMATAVAPKVRI
jgi:hypothetical protein